MEGVIDFIEWRKLQFSVSLGDSEKGIYVF